MGAFESCFGGGADDVVTPDPEVRRQQMLEAAERRQKASENRGIKNPQKVKDQQKVSFLCNAKSFKTSETKTGIQCKIV